MIDNPLFMIQRGMDAFRNYARGGAVRGYADGGEVDLFDDASDTPQGMGALATMAAPQGGIPAEHRADLNRVAMELITGGRELYNNPRTSDDDALLQQQIADSDKWNKVAMWLNAAKGFASPTSAAGGFMESLGNAAGATAPYVSKMGEQAQRNAMLQQQLKMKAKSQGLQEMTQGVQMAQALGKGRYIRTPNGLYDTEAGKLIADPRRESGPMRFIQAMEDPSLSPAQREAARMQLHVGKGFSGAAPAVAPLSSQAAAAMGVPEASPQAAPWAHISDPKAVDRLKHAESLRISKLLDKEAEGLSDMRARAMDAKRVKTLNEQVSSGPSWDAPILGAAKRLAPNAAEQEMIKITDRLAPALREAGSGAMSDKDVAMYKNATMGIGTDKAVNQVLADSYIAAAQRGEEYHDFKRAYFEAHRHLNGAEQAWKTYANANPIFDSSAADEGRMVLNTKRTPWQSFFQKAAPAPGAAKPTSPAPNQTIMDLLKKHGG
jgi:hypothetical protein